MVSISRDTYPKHRLLGTCDPGDGELTSGRPRDAIAYLICTHVYVCILY